MSKRNIIYLKSHQHKPNIPCGRRSSRKSHAPVPAEIIYCAEEERPRDFDDGGGEDEGEPVVDF